MTEQTPSLLTKLCRSASLQDLKKSPTNRKLHRCRSTTLIRPRGSPKLNSTPPKILQRDESIPAVHFAVRTFSDTCSTSLESSKGSETTISPVSSKPALSKSNRIRSALRRRFSFYRKSSSKDMKQQPEIPPVLKLPSFTDTPPRLDIEIPIFVMDDFLDLKFNQLAMGSIVPLENEHLAPTVPAHTEASFGILEPSCLETSHDRVQNRTKNQESAIHVVQHTSKRSPSQINSTASSPSAGSDDDDPTTEVPFSYTMANIYNRANARKVLKKYYQAGIEEPEWEMVTKSSRIGEDAAGPSFIQSSPANSIGPADSTISNDTHQPAGTFVSFRRMQSLKRGK
ncbi:hypothetical protein NEOLI_001953 [Neolecta irregularis DAH-3]|uniref:Uncharacterized protein n=1 Tax=Neolecta irregularis (strain DAH-3) TaxID=1198029 RepID=A0A1U7LWV6_NEOID|nr:hypothetical protein NEOLI_001953 [Neolecta irregularis DAH-3]|eukprot:OLL27157.1 hypothetical protein NEOLI_001953 [Neolecta irregularis DAH-3]